MLPLPLPRPGALGWPCWGAVTRGGGDGPPARSRQQGSVCGACRPRLAWVITAARTDLIACAGLGAACSRRPRSGKREGLCPKAFAGARPGSAWGWRGWERSPCYVPAQRPERQLGTPPGQMGKRRHRQPKPLAHRLTTKESGGAACACFALGEGLWRVCVCCLVALWLSALVTL